MGVPSAPRVNGSLAKIMQSYFTAFVEKGDPNVVGLPRFPTLEGGAAQNFNDSLVGEVRDSGLYVSRERCDWWRRFYVVKT